MKTDNDLKQDVLEQLQFDRGINADKIRVSVRNGAVTVRGDVPTYTDKLAAARAVKHVCGVRTLNDEIKVHLPASHQRKDAEIATVALNAIKWITTVPTESIRITARDGWLFLNGSVENWSQKDAAEAVVRHLTGVVGVTNLIALNPEQLPPDIKEAIKGAFERHALLDAKRIDVTAEGTKIVLQGTASSILAREEAERAAWSARGVTAVENHIIVELQ